MAALADHFYPGDPLTAGQVLDVGDIDYSEQLKANAIFKASNRSQRAAVLPVTCLVLG